MAEAPNQGSRRRGRIAERNHVRPHDADGPVRRSARANHGRGRKDTRQARIDSINCQFTEPSFECLGKGLVRRDEKASPHVYRPTLTREKAGKRMLSDLIEKVYDGAAMSLVLQALASSAATKEELDEVRRMLDQMEEKQS